MNKPSSRRAGGRSARKAMRAAPLSEDIRPIRAGLEGGSYSPLSNTDVERIHEAALTALEEIGLCDAPQNGVDYLSKAGAQLDDDGRIRFPRHVVEHALEIAARGITLCGREAAR